MPIKKTHPSIITTIESPESSHDVPLVALIILAATWESLVSLSSLIVLRALVSLSSLVVLRALEAASAWYSSSAELAIRSESVVEGTGASAEVTGEGRPVVLVATVAGQQACVREAGEARQRGEQRQQGRELLREEN